MEKLLILINLGQSAYGRWLFRRLLPSVIVIAGITMVISLVLSAVLIGGLVATYYALLSYPIGQTVAVMITIILAILIVAVLIICILAYLSHLQRMPKQLFKESPLTSHAITMLDAFSDGLMAE